jgi:hypothetical protein
MKSQISFEFITIFGLALFILFGLIFLINNRATEIRQDEDLQAMKRMTENMKNEVLMAGAVSNNYIRKITLPMKLNNRKYNIFIEDRDVLNIEMYKDDKVINHYSTAFPIKVKGNFVQDFIEETAEHCITKSDFDGIRFARNQASIDPVISTVNQGDTFDVVLGLHCIDETKSLQFTIKYDPDKLELLDAQPLGWYTDKEYNPMFNYIKYQSEVNGFSSNGFPYMSSSRYSYTVIGSECGQLFGSIALIKFKALSKGEAEIAFDDALEGEELQLWDCSTNENLDFEGTKFDGKITIV